MKYLSLLNLFILGYGSCHKTSMLRDKYNILTSLLVFHLILFVHNKYKK